MSGSDPDGPDTKATLRRDGRRRLESLTDESRVASPDLVIRRILDHPDIPGSGRISGVLAYLGDGIEIDLDPTIERLFHLHIPVAVPGVLETRGSMVPVKIDSLGDLERDRYGLRVPRKPWTTMAPEGLSVVLVPGVAFTRTGHRLGRGGGYYDRLLSTLPETVIRIGVCHEIQVVEEIPIEVHDAVMDEILIIPATA